MRKLRTIVVDEKEQDRKAFVRLLSTFDQVEVIAQMDALESARTFIDRGDVDAIFLDGQVQHVSGFDFAARLNSFPRVVFVTRAENHATRAFDVRAADYLLKPVQAGRLALTMCRLTVGPRGRTGTDGNWVMTQ